MRNFLGLLRNIVRRNEAARRPGVTEAPSHAACLEACLNCAFDTDAVWYYERLKWQTRD